MTEIQQTDCFVSNECCVTVHVTTFCCDVMIVCAILKSVVRGYKLGGNSIGATFARDFAPRCSHTTFVVVVFLFVLFCFVLLWVLLGVIVVVVVVACSVKVNACFHRRNIRTTVPQKFARDFFLFASRSNFFFSRA